MESFMILALIAAVAGVFMLWRRAETRAQKQAKENSDGMVRQTADKVRLESEIGNERRESERLRTKNGELEKEMTKYREQAQKAENKLAAAEQSLQTARQREQELAAARETMKNDAAKISSLQEELKNERENNAEKIKLLQEADAKMTASFKNLAQQILEEKGKKFEQDSKKALQPLEDNLEQFRKRMDELNTATTAERQDLKTYIEQVQKNAVKMSSDADNLTRALKGDKKLMGNWGENTLKRLLEVHGLNEGVDYKEQPSFNDEGSRVYPDFVIYLPEKRHLVIDAKVSLVAYGDFVAAADDEAREEAVKRHLLSVNRHIDTLSKKNYAQSPGLNAPDFVFLFMPVEPAFHVALQYDSDLFSKAFEKKIVLSCTSTLLPVLKTVSYMRRMENQNENAREISVLGGKLYNKIRDFYKELDSVGRALDTAQKAYDKAHNRITSGRRDSMIGLAQALCDKGVPVKESLPEDIIQESPALASE